MGDDDAKVMHEMVPKLKDHCVAKCLHENVWVVLLQSSGVLV